MQTLTKLTIVLFFLSIRLHGQESEIDRLIQSELKMTFPSIHFKRNSTDYTSMPYSVDSCFKYIAIHFDESINSLVIWRDSTEAESLTIKRVKKLKSTLNKYLRNEEFEIYSMGDEQKVSRRTINMTADSSKIKYLLTLNSVFDISKTRLPFKTKESHVLHPKIWCGNCWKNGFHLNKRGRDARKMARRNKKSNQTSAKQNRKVSHLPCWMNLRLNKAGRKRCKMERRIINESKQTEKKDKKKSRRHLVWTGWKTGFHWSTTGK